MITSDKLKIAHLIPLDTIGGAEQLYSHFIGQTQDRFEHYTINDRLRVAPMLEQKIRSQSRAVYSTKLWHQIKLPKWPQALRQRHLKHVMQEIAPDILLVWNKVEGLPRALCPPQTTLIYYEHGAGWYSPQPDQVNRFLANVDGIICNSAAAKAIITHKWNVKPQAPVEVCYNCVRSECLPQTPPVVKKLSSGTLTLGLAGRLVSRKGIPLALHAVKILNDAGFRCRLRIAGTGPEESEFRALTETLAINEQVEFLGLVKDMAEFYQSIDLFLCPSVTEPFGLVAAEAMAQGCPVIAAQVDGLAEVVEDGVSGRLVPPRLPIAEYARFGGTPEPLLNHVYDADVKQVVPPHILNPRDLASAIRSLAEDPIEFSVMSKAAAQQTQKRFHPQKYGQELANMLEAMRRDLNTHKHS